MEEKSREELQGEVQQLRDRLEVTEETLRAITQGEVDAIVVSTPQGEQIFTLQGADYSYRLLVEEMKEGAVTLSSEGILLYCNRRFAALLKKPLQKVIGSNFRQYIDPLDLPLFNAILRQARYDIGKGELSLIARDGTSIPVKLTINNFPFNAHGEATCVIVTDLTEQKRNQEIIEAERLARLILEQAAEAIVVCDDKGKIIRASQTAHDLCGENAIFQHFDGVFSLQLSKQQEGKRQKLNYQDIISENPFFLADVLDGERLQGVEVVFQRKDGHVFNLLLSARSLIDAGSQFKGCVVTLTDITQRKQMEQALRESEERFRRAVINAPVPIMLHAEDGEVLQINRIWTACTGYTHQDIPTLGDWTEKAYGTRQELVQADIAHLYSLDRPIAEGEYTITTRNGATRIWEFYSAPLGRLADGRRMAISTAVDITTRKQAEANLHYLNEVLENRVQERTIQLAQINSRLQQELQERKRAEQAVQESQFMLNGIIEGTTDQIAALDSDFKFIAFNSAYKAEFFKLFGRDIEIGTNLVESLAHLPEEQAKYVDIWRRALAGEQFTVIQEFGDSTRQRNYYEITYSNIKDKNGQRIGAAHIVKDVSDRIRAEQGLRVSERRLTFALKGAKAGIWEWNLNTQQAFWSDEHYTLMGYELGCCEASYDIWLKAIHPEDQTWVNQYVKQVLETNAELVMEYRVLLPDGTVRWLRSLGTITYDEQGNQTGMTGIVIDISDRKQLEQELAQQKELLDAFFNSAHVGLCTLDDQMRYFMVNQALAEINGVCVEDHIGKTPWEVVPDLAPQQEEVFRQVLTTGQPVPQFEVSGETQKLPGVMRTWLVSYFPIRHPNNQPIGIGIVVVEITERKAAEASLRDSEARFQVFMNNSPLLAWITDDDGKLLYCNRPLEHWHQRSLDELIGKTIFQLHPPEIAQQHLENIRYVVNTGQVLEINESAYCLDGKLHEFLTYKFPLNPVNGQCLVGGLSADISDRIHAEQALRESEERFRTAFDSAAIGMALVALDGHWLKVNQTLCEITGYSEPELLATTFQAITHPDDVDADCAYAHQLLAGDIRFYHMEKRYLHKQGHTVWVFLSASLVRDHQGQPLHFIAQIQDISDRKQAEKQLEFQAVITRNIAEGICLVRAADGVIVYTNRKFEIIFGYESGELIGKPVSIVNYEDEHTSAQDVTRQISDAILKHGEVTYEVKNVKKDGTPFWCRATTSTFNHPEHGMVFVAIQQDITEQKQVDEKIIASLREKEVLLKEIHHRVKNNLQIVSSLLQMQVRRVKDQQAALVLRDSQHRIASIALVHEKLYRSEDLANIDFTQYIPDLTTHLFDSYNISSDNVSLHTSVDKIFLEVDTAIPCGLIVNELVSNSLKYAFPDNRVGEIKIEFHGDRDDILTLIVRDNGIGIPEDFDIETTTSLGLTLVQGLVEQLEGTLECARTQGTEFRITFPAGRT